ncbi:hypothetical protein H8356DRAFT_1341500 [Neocallimastix lanati (nom. inval.)]|nr:hypothetical protein H8356DRAFT_1341500 [Neocallimastix sp. JGI-2020a]
MGFLNGVPKRSSSKWDSLTGSRKWDSLTGKSAKVFKGVSQTLVVQAEVIVTNHYASILISNFLCQPQESRGITMEDSDNSFSIK